MLNIRFAVTLAPAIALLVAPSCHAFATGHTARQPKSTHSSASVVYSHAPVHVNDINITGDEEPPHHSRRSFITASSAVFSAAVVGTVPFEANAAADCFKDCLKNCKLIAPKDPQYCQGNCQDYCDQPDRTDGLSGSVSSAGGETGILGTTTVVKGEDKPPEVKIPGLDFTGDKGRKLLGY